MRESCRSLKRPSRRRYRAIACELNRPQRVQRIAESSIVELDEPHVPCDKIIISEAQEQGAIDNQLPAALLARFVFNSWEGALLRMRAEKSDAPLIEFKGVVFRFSPDVASVKARQWTAEPSPGRHT